MIELIIDEETKAKLAEQQTTASFRRKAFYEFMLQDYADRVKAINKTCVQIGVSEAEFVDAYMEAVALNIACCLSTHPGMEPLAAKITASMLETWLNQTLKELR